MQSFKDDWVKENVSILERHDRTLHDLEISIISLAAEIKVIKAIVIAAVGAASLAATVLTIVRIIT